VKPENKNLRCLLDTNGFGKVYFEVRQADLATLAQLIEHSIRNRKVSSLSLEGGSIIFKSRVIYIELHGFNFLEFFEDLV
jgi:hypothetical protein